MGQVHRNRCRRAKLNKTFDNARLGNILFINSIWNNDNIKVFISFFFKCVNYLLHVHDTVTCGILFMLFLSEYFTIRWVSTWRDKNWHTAVTLKIRPFKKKKKGEGGDEQARLKSGHYHAKFSKTCYQWVSCLNQLVKHWLSHRLAFLYRREFKKKN